jgi:hypothetical protein
MFRIRNGLGCVEVLSIFGLGALACDCNISIVKSKRYITMLFNCLKISDSRYSRELERKLLSYSFDLMNLRSHAKFKGANYKEKKPFTLIFT